MPRNVRNLWLTLDVDGRKSVVQTGPIAKDGGFTLRIQIRRDGQVCEAGYLYGSAALDGTLSVTWEAPGTDEVLANGHR